MSAIQKDRQFYKFALYGFLKNLNFSEPFIILFFRQEGLSFTAIGLLFSIRSVLVNVLEIPSGIFADGYGKRRAMMLCFAAYIAFIRCLFLSWPSYSLPSVKRSVPEPISRSSSNICARPVR